LVLALTAGVVVSQQGSGPQTSAVVSQQEAQREDFDWGTLYSYFNRETYGTRDGLAAVAVIKAGREIHPPHQHAEEEYLMVLEGLGTWHLNGQERGAKAGDMLYAAPWDVHGVKNTGKTSLRFVVWKWNSKGVAPLARPTPQDLFWSRIQSLCGRAFSGRLSEGSPADSVFRRATLTMHVRSCTPTEIRIPFHADADRSRTWVLTRTTEGLRLKHDHRHADGTEDAITQYGGDTRDSGSVSQQEFNADAHTASLIPAARTNVWTVEILPGDRFAYALRRVGTDRRFRVEFDLRKPIAPPPPPWGATP
jgi:quercetin dioxygenase-like cupin family protein